MKIITSSLRLVVAAAGVCLLAGGLTPVLAQGPGSGGPAPGTPAATDVPLDGGASLLLAAGAAYGLKRIRARRAKAQ